MVMIYWLFPGSDTVQKHTAMRRRLLCRFGSAAMQSFRSDTGGRNGLSLLQREKREEWWYGETEGVGMGVGRECVEWW